MDGVSYFAVSQEYIICVTFLLLFYLLSRYPVVRGGWKIDGIVL